MSEVGSFEASRPDRRRLAAVVGDPDCGPIMLSTPTGEVELPKVASAAVRRLLEELAAGTPVHVIAADAVLTTSEAGEVLGLSRTYVTHWTGASTCGNEELPRGRSARLVGLVLLFSRR